MEDIFANGKPVSLEEILSARDWRAKKEHQLMADFPEDTVVSLKLNIPGAVKNSTGLQAIFELGWETFCQDSIGSEKYETLATGPEGFLIMTDMAAAVKYAAVSFEETHPLGRLFDCDVMQAGQQLSRTALGLSLRTCYICNRPAKDCARAQRHTLTQLKKALNDLIEKSEFTAKDC